MSAKNRKNGNLQDKNQPSARNKAQGQNKKQNPEAKDLFDANNCR